jgi:penicillin-binding protein 2
MFRDNDRQKLFSRRTAILAGGKFMLLSALVGRMYYLQVIESERYKTLAEDNRINLRLLPPPRGRLVDRFGQPVAINQQNYRVVVIPEQTSDLEGTLEALGEIIPIGPVERRRILRDAKRRRGFVPVTIRENLSWQEVASIEINTPDLPGVNIDVGQSRFYPYGDSTAHVLGYVAPVAEGEAKGDPLLQLPGFRIGKAGVERIYDMALRGTGGSSQVEVNAYGRMIRELERQEGQPGQDVTLTIDLELQHKAAARFGEESGSAVVIDIHTGAVLCLVSVPTFDPNAFNRGLTSGEWEALTTNERSPLTNKAVAGQYPPGSTFKLVTAMAALERGAMVPSTRVFCLGSTRLGNAEFHCWKKGGHGSVDMLSAIALSCDCFFYEAAKRVGLERIAAMAEKLGLGKQLKLDLPGEQPGLVPSNAWKKKALGSSWQLGETLILGIGQGYILTTPLQLAVMTARLVNGGKAIVPHLSRDLITSDGIVPRGEPQFENLGFIPEHVEVIRRGMDLVCNQAGATAFTARIKEAAFRMGGKTGSAQVRRISKAERDTGVRKNEHLPWRLRDHALFVAYAPVDNPRYACAVVVEHGGGGGAVAAPICRDILLEAQKRNSARPSTVGSTVTAEATVPPSPAPSVTRPGGA